MINTDLLFAGCSICLLQKASHWGVTWYGISVLSFIHPTRCCVPTSFHAGPLLAGYSQLARYERNTHESCAVLIMIIAANAYFFRLLLVVFFTA